MTEISLEHLKQLLPSQVHEADYDVADNISFKELCKKYQIASTNNVSIKTTYDFFVHKVLSNYKAIRFVGDGSSRAAFACIGGKCIKLAKIFAGVAQNKQEEKHTSQHWWKRNYDCFTKTYGHNDGYEMLLSECCARINSDKELANALGIDDQQTMTIIVWAIAQEKSHDIGKSATSLRAKCATWQKSGGVLNGVKLTSNHIDAAKRALEWLESFKNGRASIPGQKSLLQIIEFWKKKGIKELLPGDVCTCHNWGYAIRENELTPVVLDVGFSQDVANKFYRQ